MSEREFQTPELVCGYMVSLLPSGIRKVLEPTPGEGNLVRGLEHFGYDVITPDNFWEWQERVEAIVANPPFSPMALGYKYLDAFMDIAGVIIVLMPWLTLINSTKRTERILDYGLISVTHLPRNVFKGSRVQTCILEMRLGYKGKTDLKFL